MFVSATFIDISEVLSKRLIKADIERFGWIFKPAEIKDISLEEFSRKDCIFRPSLLGSPNWHSYHTLRLRSSRSEVDSLTGQLPHDRIRSSTQRTMLIVAKLLEALPRYIPVFDDIFLLNLKSLLDTQFRLRTLGTAIITMWAEF